jgi:membrane-bound lytic murein transglycosylase D
LSYKQDEAPEVIIENEPLVYVVRSGDVLGTIARKHGVSVSQLQAWNNIRGTLIRPGQKLYIYK